MEVNLCDDGDRLGEGGEFVYIVEMAEYHFKYIMICIMITELVETPCVVPSLVVICITV